MATFDVNIEIDELPEPSIDDDAISNWIEARLNEGRNLFVNKVNRGHGSGVRYRRRRRSEHQGSAPGDFPAGDTGALAASIGVEMEGPRSGRLFSDIEYARYLTEGTMHMALRKMLHDAMQEVLEQRPQTDQLANAAKLE